MAKDSTKSMTEGKPFSLIMGFALPVFFGLLFQQFYSMVDTMIVGKFLGEDALGAVGATGSLNFLIIGFCTGVCNGFAIPVAHQFGAKKDSNLRRVVANSVWLCLIFAAVMTVITVIFCRNILTFMNTPADLIDDSYKYIVIIFAGIPAVYLYNMVAGIIRSLGDSRTPVYFLALASIINIVLDVVFICLVHTGVEGAAFATVISQAISGIACVLYMKKKFPILKISKEEWKFDSHWAKTLCSMGIPMGLQYSITAIGSVILQTSVNSLGKLYVTSVTAAQKLAILFWCPYDALGTTMATYAGQNVGAGKEDRARKAMRTGMLLGVTIGIFVSALSFFRGDIPSALFTGNQAFIARSAEYLKGFAPEAILTCLVFSYIGYFNGHGKTIPVMVQGISASFLVRVPLSYLFSIQKGATLTTIGYAVPLASVYGIIFFTICYLVFLRKMKK